MTKVLEGKVAVITGGNSGMGLATAKRFVAGGAHVVITGRRQEQIDMRSRKSAAAKLSVIDRLYATVKEKYDHIDILFANAGLGNLAPIGQVTEENFDLHFNVNVKGLFFTVQKALPLMKDGGSIILNASIASSKGMQAMSVYSATKAAVRSFARTWTVDLKERKIRVNAVSPGPIATPTFGKMGLTAEQQQQFGAQIVEQMPMGRISNPDEIASAVLFLASSESSFVTGIEPTVDGGTAQI